MKIPILDIVDDVVIESSLAACSLAAKLAAAGRNVILAGSALSPGREVAVACRAWHEDTGDVPAEKGWRNILQPALDTTETAGKRLIDLTSFTLGLENRLLDAGVRLLHGQSPAGLIMDRHGTVHGVILGGNAGLFGVLAERVIDASDTATLSRIAIRSVLPPGSQTESVSWINYADEIPEGYNGDRLAPGIEVSRYGPWLQWTLSLPVDKTHPEWMLNLSTTVRRKVIQAMKSMHSLPDNAAIRLVRGGDALLLRGTWRPSPTAELPRGLFQPSALSMDIEFLECNGMTAVWNRGIEIANHLASRTNRETHRPDNAELVARTSPPGSVPCPTEPAWGCSDPAGECARHGFVSWDGAVCAVTESDVIVAGGGTSGIPAATEAARQGRRVRMLDPFADAGGTQTLGGVASYWYGRKTDYVAKHDKEIDGLRKSYGLSLALAKFAMVADSGVHLHLPSRIVGVGYANARIEAVLAVGTTGLMLHRGRNFIDATGAGDLAAWTDHPYAYGSGRDEATLWYSFGKFIGARENASREYESVVDLRNPYDLTRAVIASRRRDGIYGRGDMPCFYCAPRESRHVLGRTTVSYDDILLNRRPPDTVMVCRSNFDIKGICHDPLVLAGFVEPDFHRNYECAIPWRALLPRDLDNVIIVGKAYSIAPAAFALARMQRDLIAMGALAGLAAATATAADTDVASISVDALQRTAIAKGLLQNSDMIPPPQPETGILLAALDAGNLDLSGQMQLIATAKTIIPELRQRMETATTEAISLLAARILWQATQDPAAGRRMIAALDRVLASNVLPSVDGDEGRHKNPDHGWAPWPCYLIHGLSYAGYRPLLPRLAEFAGRMPLRLEMTDRHFHYVFAVACAAERFADPQLAPILKQLLSLDWLRDKVLTEDRDPRLTRDTIQERFAYLTLCLARAGFACGLPDATTIQDHFRRDQRRWLARSAGGSPERASGTSVRTLANLP